MKFNKCSINGIIYGDKSSDVHAETRVKNKYVKFSDPVLLSDLNGNKGISCC